MGDTHATVAYTGIPALPCLYAYDMTLNTPHFRRRGRGGKTPQNMLTLHSTALTDGECTRLMRLPAAQHVTRDTVTLLH